MIGFTRRAMSLPLTPLRLRGSYKVPSLHLKKVGGAANYSKANPLKFSPELLKAAPNALQITHER
jgi:hypothetical protein